MKNFISTYFLWITFIIILLQACSSGKMVFKTEDVKFVYETPPGTVKIDSNLYADINEMRNIDYREYVYWNSQVFGQSSSEYLNALVDTSMFAYADSVFILPLHTYFLHPLYNNFPVIGISYTQASNYARWRSDRVLEHYLIKNKIIESNPKQKPNSYFSIENYFAGKYMNYQPVPGIPIPHFRLPTIEEWERFARCENDPTYGIDKTSKKIKKSIDNELALFLTKEFVNNPNQTEKIFQTYTITVRSFPPNSNGLYNMIGNVAELTNEEGIVKGGSWMHSKEESAITNKQNYSKAENWLGFRCVCSWEYMN